MGRQNLPAIPFKKGVGANYVLVIQDIVNVILIMIDLYISLIENEVFSGQNMQVIQTLTQL